MGMRLQLDHQLEESINSDFLDSNFVMSPKRSLMIQLNCSTHLMWQGHSDWCKNECKKCQ